ncbi:MAG: hypothetical protein WCR58_05500 [Bacteroidales bacterium]|jgi:hypothetical protein|nr:hypothetical protein [Bacteroidales bacterium]MDY0369129.1 hypothetical protein [Bacteroidales bacterium]
MNNFILQEVSDRSLEKLWLRFPSVLYKDDPNYVRPLDEDVQKLFDKEQNKKLRKGEAIRWLLYDTSDRIIGRIAAFIDPHTAAQNEQPTGGCGFFDCIDDQNAANMLFDASKKWLLERGMEAMDGSINFGDRDNFWGVLVDGFTTPVFNMPYNFPYYKNLFEGYGFQNYFNQYTFRRMIYDGDLSERVLEKAERISQNPDYRFEMVDWKRREKYAMDFMTIYNKAWGVIPGVKKITEVHAMALLKQMKPILDPRLVNFGYYKDEPIAFFIMVQDLNQIIKGFNGKLHLLNKLRFMYRLKLAKRCNRIVGRIFGIVPEHQGKGVDGAIIIFFKQIATKKGFPYNELQMNWIGDFNPPMLKVVEGIGGQLYKTHVTYRYLFDRSKPFKRAERQS